MEYFNPNDYWRHQDYDNYNNDMTDEERMKMGCFQGISIIAAFIIGMLLCMICESCTTTEYVPVVEHHTDTMYISNWQRDSVWLHDSIHVTEKGDTVRIEKWHTKYVLHEVNDTTYISKTDTVPQPYPVIKEVPAELSWWQQTRLHIANILLWALLIVGIVWIIKKKLLP